MERTLATWLALIERRHPKSVDMGLERVRAVATRMALPKPACHVVAVGGTNGKGSTVAFIEAIASAAGWRVGAYTSPHLLAYNERVRIDGRDADDAALVAAFEAVEAARGDTTLTYFEYGTLAALWLFARSDLDLAILEVGLGGRLDATNIIDPDVAVITTVDLDHQDWLGEDREAIGFEKAGIARAWTPLVLGEDDPPASVLRHAYAIGASAIRAGCDFFFEPLPPGDRGDEDAYWRWREVGCELILPRPARLPGRLQRSERDGVQVLVDVGHNPQAARALAAWLAATPTAGRTHAVFAALGDKDAGGVASALEQRVDAWHLAGLDVGERGQSVDALAARLAGTSAADGRRHAGVATALAAALEDATPGDRVIVFGSFHTAAEAMTVLGLTPS